MYQNRSTAIEAEQSAMDSIARLSEAIGILTRLCEAVRPFSRTATTALEQVLSILVRERDAAIERRVKAAKQI